MPERASRHDSLLVRVRIRGVNGPRGIERSEWLTPYGLEVITADARRAGAGSCVEVLVPAATSDHELERVGERLGPLRASGADLIVRRSSGEATVADATAA
jgi:hypothetical protein